MSNVEKLYDIRLSLNKEESEMLIQILEAFACEIDGSNSWSGGKSAQTINFIDNTISTITLCIDDDDDDDDEVDFKNANKWFYRKGG